MESGEIARLEPGSATTKRTAKKRPKVNLSGTSYDVVTQAAEEMNLRVTYTPSNETAALFWQDGSTTSERVARLKPWQRINKVPGIQHIARKNLLGKHLNGMRELMPGEFDFFP
jgi:hypothetical protein